MHVTEHSFLNRSRNHPSHAMRLRRSVAFVASLCSSPSSSARPASAQPIPHLPQAKGKGRMTIVYQDDAIQPENRDAIKKIKDSGVFERMADRLTKAVALPHDLQVVVTDKLPKGFDDPTTEVDGGEILWPAVFSKRPTTSLLSSSQRSSPQGCAEGHLERELHTDILNVWGNQFILGHEMGHASSAS